MLDLGVYCLYPMLLLFGKPLGVKASAVKIPGGVDGAGFALLDYGSFDACVHYSKVSTSFLPCEIAGEDATMTVDRLNIPGRIEIKYRNGKTEDIEFDQRQDSMCYEIDAFISAVNEFKRAKHALLAFPLPMSLAAAEICDEIRRQTGISYPADAH
ncbi:scyllo-inositol 2-dehydrogenase (NADP(+)) IolU [bioreactor metagenome]|uniref:Scyllo-inositol 2-dehydrogenase (NADP(+)) IolU n=1 Tax=bioreactor metagenome TaxID=1076179 RepID=A0A645GTU7_9ZZZZ